MEDQHDPRISAYRPAPPERRWRMAGARGARWRMPVPPWGDPPPKLTEAECERQARAQARAEAVGARLHLVGLVSTTGVIVMCVVLAAVVILLAWVVIFR